MFGNVTVLMFEFENIFGTCCFFTSIGAIEIKALQKSSFGRDEAKCFITQKTSPITVVNFKYMGKRNK